MARSAYKCKLEISFINNDKEIKIDPQFVKYIMIENLYESRYMPVIYLSMAVPNVTYDSIIKNEKTGKILLQVQRYNVFSSSAIYKNYIKGQFSYILSTSNPNYSQDLSVSVNADNAYRGITIALMSMEILNLAKTSFNGVYGEIDQNTLILKALEGLNAIVKGPLYNPVYDTIVIPALNSKQKLLRFIFNKCPFYDTNYMFFIDFTRAYLLDLSGEYCDGKDNQLDTVYIDIQKVTREDSYYEGMEIKNKSYYIHINPANTTISEEKGTNKVSNQLVFVDDDGKVDFVNLNINNNIDSDLKQTFVRGKNAKMYKNLLESNTIVIEVMKENIDSLILTPNKQYIVNNSEDYNNYNGKYTLQSKKEVIKNINGDFTISVLLGLRKVGNITSIGSNAVESAIKKNQSPLHKYAKSNSKTTTTTAVKASSVNVSTNISGGSIPGTIMMMPITEKVIPMVTRIKASGSLSLKRTAVNLNEEAK